MTKPAGALHGQKLVKRDAARFLVIGEDHLADRTNAISLEEHMLSAAEPDALGAELQRHTRVVRRVGIGAHAEPAHLVRPAHENAELAG